MYLVYRISLKKCLTAIRNRLICCKQPQAILHLLQIQHAAPPRFWVQLRPDGRKLDDQASWTSVCPVQWLRALGCYPCCGLKPPNSMIEHRTKHRFHEVMRFVATALSRWFPLQHRVQSSTCTFQRLRNPKMAGQSKIARNAFWSWCIAYVVRFAPGCLVVPWNTFLDR